jgi:hypothetical protein
MDGDLGGGLSAPPGPRPRHATGGVIIARKYSKAASAKVAGALDEFKQGTLRSGSSRQSVKSRAQAIAIGLSEARRAGKKVPKKAAHA